MNQVHAGARLLLIDDNTASNCLLKNVLNRFGFQIIECITDSRKAAAAFETFGPDLVVLDLNMPYFDGLEVMQQLAQVVSKDAFLPVLVISGEGNSHTKVKALAAGATDFLAKPFQPMEVYIRIRNLLEIRFLQKQLREQNQTLEDKVAERTKELRDSQQQIVSQERLRAFGEMAGGIVHDFNNALMSVIGYSEILLNDDEMLRDLATARQFLTVMNTAGHDASQVISRLRDFYRPRELTDVFSRVDLNEVIEQSVPLTQPKWKGQALADGRAISVELDLAKVPPLLGNASELREVATNLIFNAVDALPHGGTITLRSGREGNDVTFDVIDTGTGMTEEVRARCLEPFFSTKGEKGTGLGLSMVFGIIKRHEGTVEILSNPGKGTTFRIRIPANIEAHEAELGDEDELHRRLRVLLVDDEPVSRLVLESYLKADGHETVTATNAGQAIASMKEGDFDLMITDHAMPGINGMQLAALTREMGGKHAVMMVTGFANDGTGPGEEHESIDLVLRKPVARREFRRALVAVMAQQLPPMVYLMPPQGRAVIADRELHLDRTGT
jgi:signal transduction histidine kinase